MVSKKKILISVLLLVFYICFIFLSTMGITGCSEGGMCGNSTGCDGCCEDCGTEEEVEEPKSNPSDVNLNEDDT